MDRDQLLNIEMPYDIDESLIENIKICTIYAYENFINEEIAKSINVRNFKPKFNENDELIEDFEINFEESLRILNYVYKNHKFDDFAFNYRHFGMINFLEALDDCSMIYTANLPSNCMADIISYILIDFLDEDLSEKFNLLDIKEKIDMGCLFYGIEIPTKNIIQFLEFLISENKNDIEFTISSELEGYRDCIKIEDICRQFKRHVKNTGSENVILQYIRESESLTIMDFSVLFDAWSKIDKKTLIKNNLPNFKEYVKMNKNDGFIIVKTLPFSIEKMFNIIKIANEKFENDNYKLLEIKLELLNDEKDFRKILDLNSFVEQGE